MSDESYRQLLLKTLSPVERKVVEAQFDQGPLNRRHYVARHLDRMVQKLEDDQFLWDHQKAMLTKARDQFVDETKPLSALFISPTGSGKTEVFVRLMECLSHQTDRNEKITPTTIVLVPRDKLVGQTKDRFKKDFPNLKVGVYSGTGKKPAPLTVMTYDSFILLMQKNLIRPEDLTAIVMDEAHRGLSDNRWTEFLKLKEKVPIFAFSASPSFDAMKDVRRLLDKESEVFGTTVRELAKAEPPCLAPVANYLYRVKVNIHNGEEPLERQDRDEIFFKAKLQAAFEFLVDYTDPETGNSPLGQTSLFFTRDTARAKQASEFFETGLRSIMRYKGDDPVQLQRKQRVKERLQQFSSLTRYTSGNEDSDREQENIIKQLDGGQLMAAFNARLFEEGTDIKRVKNIFNLDTSESLVTALQRGGRGIRYHKDIPDAQCNVIDMFVEYQGNIQGNPQFYADAIDDPSLAVTITTTVDVDEKGKITNPTVEVPESPTVNDVPAAAELEGSSQGAVILPSVVAAAGVAATNDPKITSIQPKEKSAALYPVKTVDWLNEEEFTEAVFAGARPTVPQKRELTQLLHDINAHYETYKGDKYPPLFQVEGGRIRAEMRDNGGKPELCLQHAAVLLAQDYVGLKRSKSSLWKAQDEFEPLVIGTGALANELRADYRKAWKKAEKHTWEQDKRRSADREPFRFNGETVRMEVMRTDSGEIKVCAHESAAYAFKHTLGVPRNKMSLDAIYEEMRAQVLNTKIKEERYGQDFDKLWGEMERTAEREAKGNPGKPVMVGKAPLKLETVYDSEIGQLQQVVPRSSAARIEQQLEIPRDKTYIWKERDEFHQLVFAGQPEITGEQERGFRNLWQQLEHHHERRTPTSMPMQIADRDAHIATCLTPEGTEIFCSSISNVRLFREHLKLPKHVISWDYSANIDDIKRIQKERDNTLYDDKTQDWLGVSAMARAAQVSATKMRDVYRMLEKAWLSRTEDQETIGVFEYSIPVERVAIRKTPTGNHLCLHKDTVSLFAIPPKTQDWLAGIDMSNETKRAQNTIAGIYQQLEDGYNARRPDQTHITAVDTYDNKYHIPVEQLGFRGRADWFCVHQDAIPLFQKKYKAEEWVSYSEMAELTTKNHAKTKKLYNALEQEFKNPDRKNKIIRIKNNMHEIAIHESHLAFKEPKKGPPVFCVHIDEKDKFNSPEHSTDWVKASDMSRICGYNAAEMCTMYKAIRNAFDKEESLDTLKFNFNGRHVTVRRDQISYRGKAHTQCFHKDIVKQFYKETKNDQWTSRNDWYPKKHISLRPALLSLFNEIEEKYKSRAFEQEFIEVEGASISTDAVSLLKEGILGVKAELSPLIDQLILKRRASLDEDLVNRGAVDSVGVLDETKASDVAEFARSKAKNRERTGKD